MIKTTLGVLYEANEAPEGRTSPLGTLMLLRLPIAKSLERLKLLEAIEVELKRHARLRQEIITCHLDGAKSIGPDHPNFGKAFQEIAELDALEVQLDFEPIKISDLGDAELSPFELRMLRFLLSE